MTMIILGGTIASGKTSLTSRLSKYLGTTPFYEPVKDNPVLPLFYKGNQLVEKGVWSNNPYAFVLQIYFLNLRFHLIKQALSNSNNVLDRSIYEDRLFMKMNYDMKHTTKAEWDIYQDLLKNMMEELPYCAKKKKPDLMIFLNISLDKQLKHIRQRGRSFEQLDTDPSLLGYYKQLQHYYADWYRNYDVSPKMKIDVDDYDFVHDPHALQDVLKMIKGKLVSIGNLKPDFAGRDLSE